MKNKHIYLIIDDSHGLLGQIVYCEKESFLFEGLYRCYPANNSSLILLYPEQVFEIGKL